MKEMEEVATWQLNAEHLLNAQTKMLFAIKEFVNVSLAMKETTQICNNLKNS